MKNWRIMLACSLALALPELAWSQQVVFNGTKARFSKSATNRMLVSKDAALVFDDTARRVLVRHNDHPLNVGYDDVQRIVFDASTHRRGGFWGMVAGAAVGAVVDEAVGSAVGRATGVGAVDPRVKAGVDIVTKDLSGARLGADMVVNAPVTDYWCYVEYKGPDGTTQEYMLEIPKASVSEVFRKMQAVFSAKVTVAVFAERAAVVDTKSLKDGRARHDAKPDKKNQPMPELKADKALVVVVCPSEFTLGPAVAGSQYKLHANDSVVAVVREGSYSFAHLDPGDYLLVAQLSNANGFRMKLEAGQEYYFLLDTVRDEVTALSRHSKELVMFELNGAYFSGWKRK